MPPPPGVWARAAAFSFALAALAYRLPGLTGNLDDLDSWRQTDTASIARNFVDEPRILWPRINWGAPGPGYVESEFQLYPFCVSLAYRVFGEDPLYGRWLSLLLTAAASWVFWRLALRFLDPGWAGAATALFVMAPLCFRYSRAFMPEATVLFFYLAALERFLAWLDGERWADLLVSAAAMALAILVKPTSIHLGLVLIVSTVSKRGWRRLFEWPLVVFGLVSLAPAIGYYLHAASLHRAYGNTFGVLSGGDSKWGGPAYWLNPSFYRELGRLDTHWIAGKYGGGLALLGLFLRGKGALLRAWAATIVVYYLIVARYAGSEGRGLQYHVYAVPLVALAAGVWLAQIAVGRWGRALAFLLFGAALVHQVDVSADMLPTHDTLLRDAGLALRRVSRPGDRALVLSWDRAWDGAVPNNFEQPDVLFHAHRTGRLLARDRQTGAELEAALSASQANWFVNFPALNGLADQGFHRLLAVRLVRRAACGEDFEIFEVRRP